MGDNSFYNPFPPSAQPLQRSTTVPPQQHNHPLQRVATLPSQMYAQQYHPNHPQPPPNVPPLPSGWPNQPHYPPQQQQQPYTLFDPQPPHSNDAMSFNQTAGPSGYAMYPSPPMASQQPYPPMGQYPPQQPQYPQSGYYPTNVNAGPGNYDSWSAQAPPFTGGPLNHTQQGYMTNVNPQQLYAIASPPPPLPPKVSESPSMGFAGALPGESLSGMAYPAHNHPNSGDGLGGQNGQTGYEPELDPLIEQELDAELQEALRQSAQVYEAEQGHQQEEEDDEEAILAKILALSLAEEEERRRSEDEARRSAEEPQIPGPSASASPPALAIPEPVQPPSILQGADDEWEDYDPTAFESPTPMTPQALDHNSANARAAQGHGSWHPSSLAQSSSLPTGSTDHPPPPFVTHQSPTLAVQPPPHEQSSSPAFDNNDAAPVYRYDDELEPSGSPLRANAGMPMSAPVPSVSLPSPSTPALHAPSAPMTPLLALNRSSSGRSAISWMDAQASNPASPLSPPSLSSPTQDTPSSPFGVMSMPSPNSAQNLAIPGSHDHSPSAHPSPRLDAVSLTSNGSPTLPEPSSSPETLLSSPLLNLARNTSGSPTETILEEAWKDITFGYFDPPYDETNATHPPPFPGVVSLSAETAFHIQTSDWRSLPRLLGRLGNTRVEASPQAFAQLQLNGMHLRLVVHFRKARYGSRWRTVLWLDLDRPIPPLLNATENAKFTSGDTTVLPYSHGIPGLAKRTSGDIGSSSTTDIIFVFQKTFPLPNTLSDVASFLTTALSESRAASSAGVDTPASMKRLHKAVDKCYPQSKDKDKKLAGADGGMKVVGKRTMGGWMKGIVGGVGKSKESKGGKHGNDDVYDVVIPFSMPDNYRS